jgi:post-segregation antitoxin (ccd killing protein)
MSRLRKLTDMTEGKNGKTLLEVEIDAELAAGAVAAGVDLSATLENALQQLKAASSSSEWRRLNRAAIDGWNGLVERDGLWADKYRD